MKRILLLRHAKSDWAESFDSDHDRPLAKRGRTACRLVGKYLARVGQVPDAILSSSALRARDTVRRAAEAGGWSCPVEVTRELYEAHPEAVVDQIRRQSDSFGSLLLAGHEPTWSHLAGKLIGGARLRFPTAALARIDFEIEEWRQLEPGSGTLSWLVTPKLLARLGLDDD